MKWGWDKVISVNLGRGWVGLNFFLSSSFSSFFFGQGCGVEDFFCTFWKGFSFRAAGSGRDIKKETRFLFPAAIKGSVPQRTVPMLLIRYVTFTADRRRTDVCQKLTPCAEPVPFTHHPRCQTSTVFSSIPTFSVPDALTINLRSTWKRITAWSTNEWRDLIILFYHLQRSKLSHLIGHHHPIYGCRLFLNFTEN